MMNQELEFDIEKIRKQRFVSRIGVTAMNFSFFFFIVTILMLIAVPLAFIVQFLYIIGLIILAIMTVGLLLLSPEFSSRFKQSNSFTDGILSMQVAIPYIYALSLAFLVLGFLFVRKDRNWCFARKAKRRAKVMGVLSVIVLVVIAVLLIGGGLKK